MAEQLICCMCGKEFEKSAKGRQYCFSKDCSLERKQILDKWNYKIKCQQKRPKKSSTELKRRSVGELTASQNKEFLAKAEAKEKNRVPKGKRINGMDVKSNKAVIADINKKARELGISYGEYIARFEGGKRQ